MQTVKSPVADQLFPAAPEAEFRVVHNVHGMFYTLDCNYEYHTIADDIAALSDICHQAAAYRGWWHTPCTPAEPDPITGATYGYVLKERNVGEMIALMHSELSEGLEAARKDLSSDHIPEFTGLEEELADALIRIFDFAGAVKLRLGEAFVAKMRYNAEREDHKMENRMAEGGKKI